MGYLRTQTLHLVMQQIVANCFIETKDDLRKQMHIKAVKLIQTTLVKEKPHFQNTKHKFLFKNVGHILFNILAKNQKKKMKQIQ